jgi:hypothetical protein
MTLFMIMISPVVAKLHYLVQNIDFHVHTDSFGCYTFPSATEQIFWMLYLDRITSTRVSTQLSCPRLWLKFFAYARMHLALTKHLLY